MFRLIDWFVYVTHLFFCVLFLQVKMERKRKKMVAIMAPNRQVALRHLYKIRTR